MSRSTVARLYADEAGESHFEDVTLDGEVRRSPTGVVARISPLDVGSLSLREIVSEAPDDEPHVAPEPLLILQLHGAVEVTASDGEVRRFGPGEICLVADTHGKGHITRAVGDGPRRTLVGPLGPGAAR